MTVSFLFAAFMEETLLISGFCSRRVGEIWETLVFIHGHFISFLSVFSGRQHLHGSCSHAGKISLGRVVCPVFRYCIRTAPRYSHLRLLDLYTDLITSPCSLEGNSTGLKLSNTADVYFLHAGRKKNGLNLSSLTDNSFTFSHCFQEHNTCELLVRTQERSDWLVYFVCFPLPY